MLSSASFIEIELVLLLSTLNKTLISIVTGIQ